MASTNKTTNYQLSQFLGTDKPAWLGDYNQDMTKIDTAMKANADAATAAAGKGDAAQATADAASAAADTAQQAAETAQNTANEAGTSAQQAKNLAQQVANYIDLQGSQPTSLTATRTAGTGSVSSSTLKVVKNNDGTLCKIYGVIEAIDGTGASSTITTSDTGLRPDAPITIDGHITNFARNRSTNVMGQTRFPTMTLNTDGTISISTILISGHAHSITLSDALLFIKDFGDTGTGD